jgi:hypothetical protein
MPGAREKSAEEIVVEMRRQANFMSSRTQVWEGQVASIEQVMGAARQAAPGDMGDVLDAQRERAMFPSDSEDLSAQARAIRDLAARGMALAKAIGTMHGRGTEAGSSQQNVRALRGIYRTPWHLALQTWLEGVAPGERTFTRASRRDTQDADIVLPGRKRYSWMLNVILDTSASMSDDVPFALGAIADFCEAVGIDEIRLVQCDTAVTSDEMLSPTELAEYEISGYGGSDLTAALTKLGADPRVTAAIVITDGDIAYPNDPMPYAVLWALPRERPAFQPPYGRIITMQREGTP